MDLFIEKVTPNTVGFWELMKEYSFLIQYVTQAET